MFQDCETAVGGFRRKQPADKLTQVGDLPQTILPLAIPIKLFDPVPDRKLHRDPKLRNFLTELGSNQHIKRIESIGFPSVGLNQNRRDFLQSLNLQLQDLLGGFDVVLGGHQLDEDVASDFCDEVVGFC